MTISIDRLKRITIAVCVTAVVGPLSGCSHAADGRERMELENGLTVLLQRVPGVGHVGVEAFYDVGFLDEPQQMTQAAHLLEHLVCHGSSKSYKQREAMKSLNAIGMANAETLPACTHYDYILPADQLGLALKIERERLTSLVFDDPLIKTEAGRCYQETDFVEANPASGMMKHALMAFSQAWKYDAEEALVRGGLEDMTVKDLRAFHTRFYRPGKLTLVIVGDFQVEQVKKLIQDNLGNIKNPQVPAETPITWEKVAKRHTVQWDAKRSGVCLAFPPPKDKASSAAMSLFGTLLMQQLHLDAELKRVADMAFCTNFTWKADPLPFFVYAAAKEGQSLEDVEQILKARFQATVSSTIATTTQLPAFVSQLQMQATSLNPQIVEQQSQMLQNAQGMDKKKAVGMVVTQAALNWAMMDRLLGSEPHKTAAQINAMVGPKLNKLIKETLDEKKMIVTYVLPQKR